MNMAIRADADSMTGTGHIMRALCLAQGAISRGWEVILYTCCRNKELLARFEDEGIKTYPLHDPLDHETMKTLLERNGADWVVLDGYGFDAGYQKALKATGCDLAVIDDYVHLDHYFADVIINQNFRAEKLSYPAEPYTKFLSGTKYVLLRNEFLRYEARGKSIPAVAGNILVSMGGVDKGNVSLKVLNALESIDDPLEINIVLGAANPHSELISTRALKSRHRVIINKGVRDMAPLMAWADVAISAGGTTLWELAFMGVPFVIFIVAANQERAAYELAEEGFPCAGWSDQISEKDIKELTENLLHDKDRRHSLSEKGKMMIDGKGVRRIINYFEKDQIASTLSIRTAAGSDMSAIYELSSEVEVRRNSFNQKHITPDEHREWFHARLKDKNTIFLVAEAGNNLVGQIRFDIDGDAVISISLKNEYRGLGVGEIVLEKAVSYLKSARPDTTMIKAYVKKENTASRRFFEKSGFRLSAETIIKNQPAVEYRYTIGNN